MALTEQLVRVGSTQFAVYEASASQLSTNSYALVLDAVSDSLAFDAAPFRSIQLSMRATDAGVTFALYGAGSADYADEELAYEWPVAAANSEHESIPAIQYRYYRLKIKSTVPDTPGTGTAKLQASQNDAVDIYWDDQQVTLGALTQGAVPADPIDFGGSGTRPRVYGFGINEDMDGSLQFSHQYREGTDISFHVHWAPTVGTGGYVKWELSYYWMNIGEAGAGAPTVITVEAAAGSTAWAQQINAFPDIVGTGKKISSLIIFKLKRIASSGSAMSGDAALLSSDAHYQIDSPGSRQRLIK